MPPLPADWSLLWQTLEKIGLAYLLSMPTGWWGEKEGHATGVRTFPIVAMASCGYLLILHGIPGSDGFAANSRVLQGLVAGIGFVGGGAIVREGMSVQGTAMAASIWNTGAIGAAVALGRYEVAIVLALLNAVTLVALVPLKRRLDRNEQDSSAGVPKSK
ncbi:MAG: MgtC/SapB family protein [Bryobacteraceae bacterium]|jgi:putative Mg2+ transporter-C (MgtC) family protein